MVDGQSAAERYQHAIRLGIDYVEFDVRKTRDRISIVYHDDCTVSGRHIGEFAYSELTEELGGEALTFEELLYIAAGKVCLASQPHPYGIQVKSARRGGCGAGSGPDARTRCAGSHRPGKGWGLGS